MRTKAFEEGWKAILGQRHHFGVARLDGVTAHWGEKDFPGLADQPAPVLAQELLRSLAKEGDDAIVIVVRNVIP